MYNKIILKKTLPIIGDGTAHPTLIVPPSVMVLSCHCGCSGGVCCVNGVSAQRERWWRDSGGPWLKRHDGL